jgi:hypothetical protein
MAVARDERGDSRGIVEGVAVWKTPNTVPMLLPLAMINPAASMDLARSGGRCTRLQIAR